MDNETIIIALASAITSILGALSTAGMLLYNARAGKKKLRAEGSKLEAEGNKLEADGQAAIAGAAASIIQGATTSNDLLLKRINELEAREIKRVKDFETRERERDERERKLGEEVCELRTQLEHVMAELTEWKNYAMRLSHQLKSHEIEPLPFKLEKKVA